MPTDTMIRLRLTGHLDTAALKAALSSAEALLRTATDTHPVLVDCRDMTSYDASARRTFVEWNSEYRNRIRGVAIVTDRSMWRMAVNTMALATKQQMQAFGSLEEAESWCTGKLAPLAANA